MFILKPLRERFFLLKTFYLYLSKRNAYRPSSYTFFWRNPSSSQYFTRLVILPLKPLNALKNFTPFKAPNELLYELEFQKNLVSVAIVDTYLKFTFNLLFYEILLYIIYNTEAKPNSGWCSYRLRMRPLFNHPWHSLCLIPLVIKLASAKIITKQPKSYYGNITPKTPKLNFHLRIK